MIDNAIIANPGLVHERSDGVYERGGRPGHHIFFRARANAQARPKFPTEPV
jgi:hypothetical protein